MEHDFYAKIHLKNGMFQAKIDQPIKLETQVIVKNSRIIDVKIHTLKDEPAIESALADEFRGQIIKAQSVNIDGISSASVLTKAVKTVVGLALAESRGE